MLPIEKQILDLERFDTHGAPALSLYVHTDPFRDSGRNMSAQLDALLESVRSGVDDDRDIVASIGKNFDAALGAISSIPKPRAVAAFACAMRGFATAVPLRFAVAPEAFWDDHLHLQPLIAQLAEHERALVMLLDKQRLRLFRIFMGEIEELEDFTDELPGRNAAGRAQRAYQGQSSNGFSVSMGYGSTNVERHHMWHVRKHMDRVLEVLQKNQEKQPVDQIFLSATPEARSEFLRLLPRRWRSSIANDLHIPMHATTAEVLAAAMAAQQASERGAEDRLIADLLERVPARAVLGARQVAEAVANRQVLTLIYAHDTHFPGALCDGCGLLMPDFAPAPCPRCGVNTRPIEDLMDQMITGVLQQRGRIEEVRGPAAERLRDTDGVAALLRFA